MDLLTDDITEAFLRAWIAEADARQTQIRSRPNWLRWGITSRYLPHEHPDLQRRSRHGTRLNTDDRSVSAASDLPSGLDIDPGLASLWQAARAVLQDQLPRDVFETWISPCQLIALEAGDQSDARIAILAVPNVFVRQELETAHLGTICQALQAQTAQIGEVRCVM